MPLEYRPACGCPCRPPASLSQDKQARTDGHPRPQQGTDLLRTLVMACVPFMWTLGSSLGRYCDGRYHKASISPFHYCLSRWLSRPCRGHQYGPATWSCPGVVMAGREEQTVGSLCLRAGEPQASLLRTPCLQSLIRYIDWSGEFKLGAGLWEQRGGAWGGARAWLAGPVLVTENSHQVCFPGTWASQA